MRHRHCTKLNAAADQLHGRPPSLPASLFSRPPPHALPSLPCSRARSRSTDGRTEETGATTGSLSLLSRLCLYRRRRRRSLSPSFGSCPFAVRSVGLGEPFRPHVRPGPSGRENQTSSKVDQDHQDPPHRIAPFEAPISTRRHRRSLLPQMSAALSARQVGGPRKPKPKSILKNPCAPLFFSGHHHCTSFCRHSLSVA